MIHFHHILWKDDKGHTLHSVCICSMNTLLDSVDLHPWRGESECHWGSTHNLYEITTVCLSAPVTNCIIGGLT